MHFALFVHHCRKKSAKKMKKICFEFTICISRRIVYDAGISIEIDLFRKFLHCLSDRIKSRGFCLLLVLAFIEMLTRTYFVLNVDYSNFELCSLKYSFFSVVVVAC